MQEQDDVAEPADEETSQEPEASPEPELTGPELTGPEPAKDRRVPKKQQDLEMVLPIKWEDWEISVKCSEDERTELARDLVRRMRKEGLREAVALRADCVLLGYATKEGIMVYDCRARRASKFSP